jgi:hypothetical protein
LTGITSGALSTETRSRIVTSERALGGSELARSSRERACTPLGTALERTAENRFVVT